MKGEQAEYTVVLKKAKMFPKRKRIRKALSEIKDFVFKHTRSKSTSIATEVNEFLHKNSKNIPQKVQLVLQKKEDKTLVFLKGGKQLEEARKKEQEKKKKEKEKKGKEEEEKTEKELEKKEEEQKKLAEKKEKEKAGQAVEMKRKTGRE